MAIKISAPHAEPERVKTENPLAKTDRQKWVDAMASPSFKELLALKTRCIAPLLISSFALIVAMTLLAGFAKDFMAQKVVGAFNVGYLLVLLTYLLCWGVSLIYVRSANQRFDAQAQAAIEAIEVRRLS
ncbi:DUF485 domain-containing protein [Hydrogenophaga sp.]|jgi:uncharacterized membrane protein (DUF485 family)|uniref:DUF485 domain-containing protein n=1 Tax=Hydrogenophaga sp. TaxID=1904254 RepID=UPI0025BA0489|nr:DUF485 domain-containing protein [Hydrogenophaga sp.]